MPRNNYFPITGYINKSLSKKLEYYCGKNNYSISKAINTSLKNLLEEESKWDVLWKRLDKMTSAIQKDSLRTLTVAEAFLFFTRYFFALTPDLDEEEKSQANQKGYVRYERFINDLISRFQKIKTGKGDRLSEKLWSEEDQPT